MAGLQRSPAADQSTEQTRVQERCRRRRDEAFQCVIVLTQRRPPFGISMPVGARTYIINSWRQRRWVINSNNDNHSTLDESDDSGRLHTDERCRTPSTAPTYSGGAIRLWPTLRWRSGPELSVIVPTFNEKENIAELIGRLAACLINHSWKWFSSTTTRRTALRPGARARSGGYRGPLHSENRPPRPILRLHRGHARDHGPYSR